MGPQANRRVLIAGGREGGEMIVEVLSRGSGDAQRGQEPRMLPWKLGSGLQMLP